jgi:hypothetical protein
MIAATRITTGPYRTARRLVRRLTKPLRLAVIRHQLALSEGNVLALEGMRIEAAELLREENFRQVALMQRQQQIERGIA